MAKVLFLDDDRTRTEAFLRRCPDATTVETAAGCIQQLQENDWELVCLDHDLGGEVYVNSKREDCGMEVVRWVEQNCPDVKTFVVHSYNGYAAPMMVQRLRDAGYATHQLPFGALIQATR